MKLIMLVIIPILILGCAENVAVFQKEKSESVSDPAFIKAFDVLVNALNSGNFNNLEPLLAEDYNVPGVPQEMGKIVMKQVVEGFSKTIKYYKIKSVIQEKENQHFWVIFQYEGEEKEYDFLLDSKGKFVEINIFHTMKKEIAEVDERNLKIPDFMQVSFSLSSNLIMVQAEIDGRKGNFLLDSGAPRLILNSKYAKSEEVNSVSGMGVSGVITGTNLKRIKKFKWQDFEMNDVDAVTMDLSHLEEQLETNFLGLIGQNELSYFEIIFDYDNKNMMLFKLNETGDKIAQVVIPNAGQEIEFELGAHIPIIDLKIGNKTYKMGLDTGAEYNLLSSELVEELKELVKFSEADTLYGADKQMQVVKSGEIISAKIGEKTFENMKTVFADISHLNAGYGLQIDGLLGYEFFSRQRTAINYKKKILYLW